MDNTLKTKLLTLIIAVFAITSSAYSQLSLNLNNATVKSAVKEIETKSNYRFFYSNNLPDLDKKINIQVNNQTITNVLNLLFKDTKISYVVNDSQIALTEKKDVSVTQSTNISETGNGNLPGKLVTGKVIDTDNEPLIGVNIREVGSSQSAVTDIDGNYRILVSNPNGSLTFSYVGFGDKTVGISNQNLINITMEYGTSVLDELIVVGYGVQKRSDVTGAISSISSEKVNSVPTTSVGEMIRGAAPGIQVSMGSAAPGGSSSILIRGRRSLSGDNSPLFIVDGVPMSSIDDVNANDIASVEVLKDASAQSIYGARAANGVVLVTTKRGQSRKPKITYNTYFASQNLYRNFHFYNGEQWAALRKEAYFNANGYYDETDAFRGLMLDVLNSGEWVDWEKLMISPALQHKHDISIQSGGDKTKMALSFGFYDQDGMVPKSDFQRLTGRLNVDHKLYKNISVGGNISYTKSWRRIADGSFNSYITVPPLAKVYNDDGTLREDVTEAGESHYNPLWNIDYSDTQVNADRYLINLFADWTISKKFSYRANGSISKRINDSYSYDGTRHTTGRNTNGSGQVSSSVADDYLFENIFNYNEDFNKKHHFDATLMQSINVIQWKRLGLNGTNFPNDDLSFYGIGNANEYGKPIWELSERRIVSFLGRARYNYLSKYLLTLALRVDGSSVFGANNKYGYFPSVAFAWRASEENFLKNIDWISNLKFRLSYGQVGNQGISPYKTLGLSNQHLTEFGSALSMGYLPGSELWNPNLKWETSTSGNIGLDFGFFKNRVNGSFEFYDTQTTDLLVNRSISQTLGYSTQMVNLGHVQNRGFEATLNTLIIDSPDFSWDMTFTYFMNRNQIKKIDGSRDEDGKYKDDINNRWFIGEPMNVYYDYVFDGIWQLNDDIANSHMPQARPGGVKVKDSNKDNQITTDDRVIMKRDPDWIGSVGTSFKYKNFDLSSDIYILQGGTMSNPYLYEFNNGGDLTAKRNGIQRNYWTMNNPSNEAPAPNMNQPPAYVNILGYQNASYVRLRNITFGYNFPKSITSKIKSSDLRLYASLSNLWTWTEVLSYGPEQTPGEYPEPRTYLIGLNITF